MMPITAPAAFGELAELQKWLREEQKKAPRSLEQLVAYVPVTEASASGRMIQDALEFWSADRLPALRENPPVRVLFALPPAALWAWMKSQGGAPALQEAAPILALRRWSKEGLRRLLGDLDLPHDERAVDRASITSTGGWPILLRELVARDPATIGISVACDRLEAELLPGRPLAATLWRAFGVEKLEPVVQALRMLSVLDAPFESASQLVDLMSEQEQKAVGDMTRVLDFLELLDLIEPVRDGRTTTGPSRRQLAPLVRAVLPASLAGL